MEYCLECGQEIEEGTVALMGVCDDCWEKKTEDLSLGFIPYEREKDYDAD